MTKRKIGCENCNKVIALGEVPASVEIKCPHCGTLNDLSKLSMPKGFRNQSYTERTVKKLDKK